MPNTDLPFRLPLALTVAAGLGLATIPNTALAAQTLSAGGALGGLQPPDDDRAAAAPVAAPGQPQPQPTAQPGQPQPQPTAQPGQPLPTAQPGQPQPQPTAQPGQPQPTGQPDQPQPAPAQPELAPVGPTGTPGKPAGAPAEGEGPSPQDGEYASSEGAGGAVSGEERDTDREQTKTTVGDIKEEKKSKGLSHFKTAMIGIAPAIGVSMITAGDKFCGEFSDQATDQDGRKPLCVMGTPLGLDISAGFGAAERIDVMVTVRVNMWPRSYDRAGKCSGDEPCADGKGLFNDQIAIGVIPGIRIWGGNTDKIVKFGGAVEIMYLNEKFDKYRDRPSFEGESREEPEAQQSNQEDEAGVGDHFVGLRGGPVLAIDPHHNVGFYIYPAMIPGFRPKKESEQDSGWFEVGFEGSIGLQVRFP